MIAAGGCQKDKDDTRYRQPFIGKWQQFECGSSDVDDQSLFKPNGHTLEFFENGTSLSYGTRKRNYRVDSEYLYYNSGKDPDGFTYRYTFTGPDTLRLDYVNGNINAIYPQVTYNIYKRIK
jgi:hypothetical protein